MSVSNPTEGDDTSNAPYMIVSSDTHAGLQYEECRPYLDSAPARRVPAGHDPPRARPRRPALAPVVRPHPQAHPVRLRLVVARG